MTNPYTKEAMTARFEELRGQIEQIESTSPRLERDANFEQLNKIQLDDYSARIREHEEGLFDLKQEYASLARALGARRG